MKANYNFLEQSEFNFLSELKSLLDKLFQVHLRIIFSRFISRKTCEETKQVIQEEFISLVFPMYSTQKSKEIWEIVRKLMEKDKNSKPVLLYIPKTKYNLDIIYDNNIICNHEEQIEIIRQIIVNTDFFFLNAFQIVFLALVTTCRTLYRISSSGHSVSF